MPFSVQGVPHRGLGEAGLPDLGEDIRAVVVVVSNGRTDRKANVRGECRFEVVRWSFEWPGVPAAFKLRIHACETGDRESENENFHAVIIELLR
jgi:hypothetical protein